MARIAAPPAATAPHDARQTRGSRRQQSEQPSTAPEADASVTVKQRAPRKKGARNQKAARATIVEVDEDVVHQDAPHEAALREALQASGAPQALMSVAPEQQNTNIFADPFIMTANLATEATSLMSYAQQLITSGANGGDEADIAGLVAELYEGTTRAAQMLRRRSDAFQALFDMLKMTEGGDTLWIQPELVLQGLTNTQQPGNIQHLPASDIFYLANIANIVKTVLLLNEDDPNVNQYLMALNAALPGLIASTFDSTKRTPGSSALVQETFDFGLDIRTQLVMRMWTGEQDQAFDAVDALTTFFYVDGGAHLLWPSPSWHNMQYSTRMEARVDQLRKAVTIDGGLRLDFLDIPSSWTAFQRSTCIWALHRFSELNESIRSKGGPEKVVADLRSQIEGQNSVQEDLSSGVQLQSLSEAQRENIRTAKRASGMLSLSNLTQAGLITMASQGSDMAQPSMSNNATGKRGLRITDRQDTADRVHFDDTQIPASSFNVTQDEGLHRDGEEDFQNDLRQARPDHHAEVARMRAQNAAEILAAREAYAASAQSTYPDFTPITEQAGGSSIQNQLAGQKRGAAEQDTDLADPNAKRMRLGDADYQPSEAGEPNATPGPNQWQTQEYAQVRARSHEVVQAYKNATKAPQKRKPWTPEETSHFIFCIEQYGTSYSKIKQKDAEHHGNILAQRDQVALKDKARNIKFDYMKSGVTPLPTNLEQVPLSNIHQRKLESMGIEYTQAAQRAVRNNGDSQLETQVEA